MMKPCVLKSYKNGVAVYLDHEMPFQELCVHVGKKFQEAGAFLKNAKLAISFEGRDLTDEEEEHLLDVISENCNIQVVCVVGKNKLQEQSFFKAISQMEYRHEDKNLGQFYKGNVKDGQVIETDYSIVIFGDVNTGCAVVSDKDIIILGGLYGEAHAGANGDSNHFVLALDVNCERLKIGNYRLRKETDKSFWPVKQKVSSKIAVVEDDAVVLKPFTKSVFSFLEELQAKEKTEN